MSSYPSSPSVAPTSGLRLRWCLFLVVACLALAPPVDAQVDTLALPPVAVDEVADNDVQERLRRVFARVEEFRDVTVEVEDGVVQLGGTVLRSEMRERAAALAARFEGVLFVDNDIEQETEVETRVAPAIQKVQDLWESFVTLLPVLGVALLIVLLFAMVGGVVMRWQAPFERLGMHPLVSQLVRRVLRAVIVLAGILLALDILDATALVGAVVGTAGIVGLALGFAFRDIVENYLAGVLLSLRRPFEAGDHVVIEGHEGRVTQLTAREMIMMTFEGNHVRLPNATVFGGAITNYSRNPRRRFDFTVGIDTSEDPQHAVRIGRRALEMMRGVMGDPAPFGLVEELGDSTIILRFFGWVDQRQADYLKTRSEAVRLVKAAMDAEGVVLPDPTYRVLMEEPSEEADAVGDETGSSVAEQAHAADVGVDDQLKAQIEEDAARTGEENLL